MSGNYAIKSRVLFLQTHIKLGATETFETNNNKSLKHTPRYNKREWELCTE